MSELDLKISITGATGFVGRALTTRLSAMRCFEVRAWTRNAPRPTLDGVQYMQGGELSPDTDWRGGLLGVDVLIHAAARVHIMNDGAANSLGEFRRVNVYGTLNLARQAAAAGVKRMVFISSVKVNGESTTLGRAFTEIDAPNPQDAYGQSKHEAEQGLRQLSLETGMEVVIIRPPLVYGPGVRANFATLMRAVQDGRLLPLGAVNNKRSLVALYNLVDFIVICITRPQAANQTFLVSDGHDLSTAELVQGMADIADRAARLLPVPVWVLRAGAALLGKSDVVQRVFENLQVDISKARSMLEWVPPVSVEDGLKCAMGSSAISLH